MNKYILSMILSFLYSILWVLIGTIFYINTIASIPALRAISGLSGTKYMLYFLWGMPLLAVVIGMIFFKSKKIKLNLISFLVGTIFFTIVISGF